MRIQTYSSDNFPNIKDMPIKEAREALPPWLLAMVRVWEKLKEMVKWEKKDGEDFEFLA